MTRTRRVLPHNRGGIWYLVRRVPKEFEHLDPRRPVKISTNIAVVDDPRHVRARLVVDQLNLQLEAYWQGLKDGQSGEAKVRFEAAQARARLLGLHYQTAGELRAENRLGEVLSRVELLLDRKLLDDESAVTAVLGGEERPRFKVSELLVQYEKLISTQLSQFSEAQQSKWRTPIQRAVNNFVTAVGDKNLADLTRGDVIKFREWWQEKLVRDGLKIATANKDIGHLNKMLREIELKYQLGIPQVFARMRLAGGADGHRTAFSPQEAMDIILSPALERLNDQARDILLIVAETGMRPSEVCSVLPNHIRLDEPIPYVSVEPEGRILKTPQSEREIPLTGNALAAFRRHPNGFPKYRDKGDALSAVVSKCLRTAKLIPTKKHSHYSFRHAFEDRLIEVDTPDKVVASLMGHKFDRPKYGKGPSLELKLRWLQKVVLPVRP